MTKHILTLTALVLLSVSVASYKLEDIAEKTARAESYVNLDSSQLDKIRGAIHKAHAKYAISNDLMAKFIYGEMPSVAKTNWNVVVYQEKDWNSKVFLTDLDGILSKKKKYFLSLEPEGFNFSVLIVETNNTRPTTSDENLIEKVEEPKLGLKLPFGLTFAKKKSDNVTTGQ